MIPTIFYLAVLIGIPIALLISYLNRREEYNNVPEYCPLCKKQLSWTHDSFVFYCKNCLEHIEIKVRWLYSEPKTIEQQFPNEVADQ